MTDPVCSMCGGQVALLGTLGRKTWGRCIACGMTQGMPSPSAWCDVCRADVQAVPDPDGVLCCPTCGAACQVVT